jgi:hypothetical protein
MSFLLIDIKLLIRLAAWLYTTVNYMQEDLSKLSTTELEAIVTRGENITVATSQAAMAKRILDNRRHTELMEALQNNTEGKPALDSKEIIIFYSWQSDLPNKINRGFIESALEIGVQNIRNDGSIKIVPRIDKDTAGISGSPNIASTILSKIDQATILLSDVTIINPRSKGRLCPNPNVLYELGYAVKSLGMENVIMVQNIEYGLPDKLPFDLKMHRVVFYKLKPDSIDSLKTKKELAKKLESAIRLIIENIDKSRQLKKKTKTDIEDRFNKLITDNAHEIVFESELKNLVDKVLDNLKKTEIYNYNAPVTIDEIKTRKADVELLLKNIPKIFFNFGKWANNKQIPTIIRQFEKIVRIPESNSHIEIWENFSHYPALIIYFALGIGALYNNNVDMLYALFKTEVYNRVSGKHESALYDTSVWRVFKNYKDIVKDDRRYFPGSDELFNIFRPYFEDLTEEKYEDLFDTFEYVNSLMFASTHKDDNPYSFWVPTGAYMYRVNRRKIWRVITDDFNKEGERWKFFKCYGMSKPELETVFNSTNKFIEELRQTHIFF